MIAKTAVDARYKHIGRKVMDEFPMILEGVVSQSRHGQDRFMISTQSPVDNPMSTIETFARQFQLTQEETEIVRQRPSTEVYRPRIHTEWRRQAGPSFQW